MLDVEFDFSGHTQKEIARAIDKDGGNHFFRDKTKAFFPVNEQKLPSPKDERIFSGKREEFASEAPKSSVETPKGCLITLQNRKKKTCIYISI